MLSICLFFKTSELNYTCKLKLYAYEVYITITF